MLPAEPGRGPGQIPARLRACSAHSTDGVLLHVRAQTQIVRLEPVCSFVPFCFGCCFLWLQMNMSNFLSQISALVVAFDSRVEKHSEGRNYLSSCSLCRINGLCALALMYIPSLASATHLRFRVGVCPCAQGHG